MHKSALAIAAVLLVTSPIVSSSCCAGRSEESIWFPETLNMKRLAFRVERVDVNYRDADGRTALMNASQFGLIDSVRFQLQLKADINSRDKNGYSALMLACVNGHLGIAELLLENGADINCRTRDGLNALKLALENGHSEIVELLIEKSSPQIVQAARKNDRIQLEALLENEKEIDATDERGNTALIWGAKLGHLSIVELLVRKGASINAVNSWESITALGYAAINGHKPVFDFLKYSGAAELGSDYQKIALTTAARNNDLELIRSIMEHGMNTKAAARSFILGARNGHLDVVKFFLEKGISVNVREDPANEQGIALPDKTKRKAPNAFICQKSYETTALIEASGGGHLEVVRLLLGHGANAADADGIGNTALFRAGMSGHSSIVSLLLEKQKNISSEQLAELMAMACSNGYVQIARILLDRGTPTDATNSGRTPLVAALEGADAIGSDTDHIEIAKLLIQKGARVNTQSPSGMTALIWASHKGHLDIARLLCEKGADVNASAASSEMFGGGTALKWAALSGRYHIVKLLLDQEADIHLKDVNGLTALMWAEKHGHKEVVELLRSYGAKE